MREIKVSGNRVLIKEHAESKKKTESGIIVPDTVRMTESTGLQKHITTGTVLSSGAKSRFAKVGDKILFARPDAAEIELEDQKYFIIRDTLIILKFNDSEITEINTDRVLIDVDPMDKITKAGIFIPENVNYEATTGTVILVGSECSEIKKDMRVLFGKAAGHTVEFRSKIFLFIREADLTGELI